MTTIIGVDYSITSPAVCVGKVGDSFSRLSLYGVSDVKKRQGQFGNIYVDRNIDEYDYSTDIQRYDILSHIVLDHIVKPRDTLVVIEGYSMGSKGKVFNLAENAGVLKYKLYERGVKYEMPSPPTVKKFATGKGNADKFKMVDAFQDATGLDIRALFECDGKNIKAPITDVVDAYWMFRYGESLVS